MPFDHDVAYFLCAGVGLTLQIALLVRGGVVQCCLRALGWLRHQLRSTVHLRGSVPKESQAREVLIAQKVAELLEVRRVELARSFVMPCSLWCFAISIQQVAILLAGERRLTTATGDAAFFLLYASVLLLMFRPSLIQARSLNIWVWFMMIMAVLAASPLVTPTDSLLVWTAATGAWRVCISLFMSLPAFVLWNVAYGISVSLHFLSGVSMECECPVPSLDGQLVLSAEVSATVALVLISRAVRAVMEGEARQQVEAQASRSGLDASESLLGTICDAVLELDADLRLRTHSPSLATILLQSSSHSLVTSKLDRFMHSEDDMLRFNESMQVPAHNIGTIADAFHVKMRDSLGSKIDMEVFHVCFVDSLTELPQHLVGLREHTDGGVPGLGAEPDFLPLCDSDNLVDQAEMAVVFDAVTFDILRCSDAFTVRFGPLPASASFADLLLPGEPQLEAFCDTVNSFANSCDPVCFFELRPLRLQLPGGAMLSKRVSFTLSFEASEGAKRQRVLGCMVLSLGRGPSSESSRSSRGRGGSVHGGSGRSSARDAAARRGTS